MSAPYNWGLVALALAATGLAIWAGPNRAVAVPAATVAIVVASLLILEVGLRAPRRRSLTAQRPPAPAPSEIRAALVSGPLGRERLIELVDHIERAQPPFERAPVSSEEMRRLIDLPADEFREYLRGRLERIEAST